MFAGYTTYWFGYWENGEWNWYVMLAVVIATFTTVAGILWLMKNGVKPYIKPLGWILVIVIPADITLFLVQDKADKQRDEYRRKSIDALLAKAGEVRAELDKPLKVDGNSDKGRVKENTNPPIENPLESLSTLRRMVLIKEYIGKEVNWTLVLSRFEKPKKGKCEFWLYDLNSTADERRRHIADVFCDVSYSKYKEKLLKMERDREETIRVHGKIRHLSTINNVYVIWLQDDPEITFLSTVR